MAGAARQRGIARGGGHASEHGALDSALDRLEWDRWLAADARGYTFAAPIVRAILLQEMVTPGQARRYAAAAGA